MIQNQFWFYLYMGLMGFIVCQVLIPIAKKVGRSHQMIDAPASRRVHSKTTLRSGGLAIYFTFTLVILAHVASFYLFYQEPWFQKLLPTIYIKMRTMQVIHEPLAALLIGVTAIYLLGFFDDQKKIKVKLRVKWLVQILAALVAVTGGIYVTFTSIPILDKLITVLWIVGITNAFNLLDNMNGLSSGVAVVCSSILLWVVIDQDQYFMAMVLSLFIGTLLGFLPHNFPKAKIFLGDQGSLVIGYILGCLTVLESFIIPQSTTGLGILVPLFVMALPLFDTLSVLTIRKTENRELFIADKSHLSHRLVDMGFSQTMAVILIYILTFIFGLAAILLIYVPLKVGIILLMQLILMILVVSFLMFYGGKNKLKT